MGGVITSNHPGSVQLHIVELKTIACCALLFRRVRDGPSTHMDILLFIVVLSCFQINHPHSLLYSFTP